MSDDRYFIRSDYITNPATTFDANEEIYWDAERANNSLSYQASVYKWARELILKNDLARVADLGCGTGAKLARLHATVPWIKATGFDQPNAINLCKDRYDFGMWVPVDFEHPSMDAEENFEFIISSDVIEHLENPDSLLSTIKHFSSEKTLILISTPERVRLRGEKCNISPIRHHVREWSELEFGSYLRSRGFEILETRLLPGFNYLHDRQFFKRALRRWLRFKSINYTQAILLRVARAD